MSSHLKENLLKRTEKNIFSRQAPTGLPFFYFSGISRKVVFILTIFFVPNVYSQNLVINPSFEDYDSCVLNSSDINYPYLTDWQNATPTTYNIYNYCTSNFGQHPSTATFGSQIPRTGNGYILVVYHNDNTGVPMGTFMQGKLSSPLVKDSFYCYKMYLISPESVRLAIDRIGVYFSDTVIQINSFYFPYFPPHIESQENIFFASAEYWTKHQGIYKAKGGEQYFTFGNFHTYPNTNKVSFGIPWGNAFDSTSYYYIDDVSIEMISASHVTAVALGNDSTLCDTAGFSQTLSVPAIYDSIFWSTEETTFSIHIQQPRTYAVTAYIGECELRDTITFSLFNSLPFQTLPDISVCETETPLSVSAVVGFDSYAWNTGSTNRTLSVTESGEYTLTVSNSCQTYSDTFTATIHPLPLPPITIDTALCEGDAPIIAGAAGSNLRWYENEDAILPLETTPVIQTDIAGTMRYFVSQTENNCESVRAVFTAMIHPLPEVELGEDFTQCEGKPVNLSATADSAHSYLWSTGDTLPFIEINTSGIYGCTVSNDCGSVDDSVHVSFVFCDDCLYIPNAFTPNADAVNDAFRAYTRCPLNTFQLHIFNRWGEKIFEAYDVNTAWNGTYKNRTVEPGVYVYYLTCEYENNRQFQQKGSVTLIR